MKKVFNKLFFIFSSILSISTVFSCSYKNIEGGYNQNSRIVGVYNFNSCEEFLDFYNVFKVYNDYRYWIPNNKIKEEHNYDVKYEVRIEGMKLIDRLSNRYDIVTDYHSFLIEIDNDNFNLKIRLNDISETNLNIYLFSPLVNITIEDTTDEDHDIFIMSENFDIASGTICFTDANVINDVIPIIKAMFRGGFKYVF